MQVYIEYVIIDNLIIDYVLIKLSLKLSRIKQKFINVFIGSLIGTIVAIIIPLLSFTSVLNFIIKILLAFLIIAVSGKFINVKKYFLTVAYFVLLTFLCGGFIIALFYFTNTDYKVFYSINYDNILPVSFSVLVVYVFSNLSTKIVSSLIMNKETSTFFKKCVIIINSNKYKINGYIDSGNSLIDEDSGLPILIISKNLAIQILADGNFKKSKGTIYYDTISGKAEMNVYSIDKLIVIDGYKEKIFSSVLVGVGKVNFTKDYDILLNQAMF